MPRPAQPEPVEQNLESFSKANVLIAGDRVDHAAANKQQARAAELRDLIQLDQEEFFNVFEMVPQTAQDIYFNKLSSGVLRTAVTSCADEMVEKDVQTEDMGQEDKAQQAPEDQLIDDYAPTQKAAANRAG